MNPHELNVQQILSLVRLPIPPRSQGITPQVGFEPTTNRLTVDGSAAELLRIENTVTDDQ